MLFPTLVDTTRLRSANAARERADQASKVAYSIILFIHHIEVLQPNDCLTIDGVLSDDKLTVFLRSLNSGRIFREKSCVGFDARELTKIGDFPDHSNGFCDVFAGETSEDLTLMIESHRCYETDLRGNASARKV